MVRTRGSNIQRKCFLTSLSSIFLASGLAGLLWGVIRIELVLLVPYFFQVVYLADFVVYTLYGYRIGRCLGLLPEKRSWALLLPPLLMYAGDRFISAMLILGIPFSGKITPLWRFFVEIVILALALGALWRGWLAIQRKVGKT